MAKNLISKISNAFSTGSGGVNFEQQIQAMFLLSLLIDGFCPAMNEQTKKVHFQAKHVGYDVDDLVVITYRNQSEGKMACQIKHSITATEKDKTFQEVICAAWNDFNKEDFDRDCDRIALVTAQISNKAQQSLRFLHAEAIGSIDAEAFMEKIDMPVFSNDDNKKMLAAIKECISLVKGCEPTNEEVWKFCKVFILLLFDMDCAESVNRALSASLIKCNSPENPILVWSRLVEYAGQCNQTAASISKENIDRNIRDLFSKNNIIQLPPDPITAIDLFIPTIALIGAWKEDNEFDCKMIEQISGMGYSEFEARARTMLSQNSEYLQLTNGNWKVCHKEELLNQCKNKLFDDSVGKLLEAVESILRQKSKCVASKMPYFIPVSDEYDNSLELRGNLVKSLCWVKKNLSELSQCNQEKIKNNIYALVSTLLQDAKWITWTSLRDCLQNLAELSPEAFLKEAERGIINNPTEIVNLFPPKSGGLSGINYISNLLWALEILAWSPEYLVHSISVLGLLEALPYERTNWTNTPINSIVSILLPWYPQTMADLEKRKNALKCLKTDNPRVFWSTLKKLLPNKTRSTSGNPRPKYLKLEIPEEVKVTNAEARECYVYLVELAVDTARNENEKQRRSNKRQRNVKEFCNNTGSVDFCRLHKALGNAHETCYVDQHHVACILPYRYENQAEHRAVRRRKPGSRERSDRKSLSDRNDCTVKYEFPYITKNDTADQVRNEEACAEEILSFDTACYHVSQQECHNVDQNDRNHGIDDRSSHCLPVSSILKCRDIVCHSYEWLRF